MNKVVLLFAGQGSQSVGMGKDLCSRYAACRSLYAQANEILERDIQEICFEGPTDVLTKTDNAQPGIFLTSLACLTALRERVPNLQFHGTAGLSLGEFTALVAAGACSFEDGLRVVQLRGGYMQDACNSTCGGMVSVIGLEEEAVARICRETDVDIANLNCPGQIVISGILENIEKAIELAKIRGAKRVIPLQVAGAYHSRLMQDAREKVAAAIGKLSLCDPRVPIVSNVTARPSRSTNELRELLIQQVTSPVRWSESMQWLVAEGFTHFIELGPGGVLSSLMKRINREVKTLTVSDLVSLEDAAQWLLSL